MGKKLNANNKQKGKLTLLNSNNISTHPIIGFDWHNTKSGLSCLVAFDRTVKICTLNKINLIFCPQSKSGSVNIPDGVQKILQEAWLSSL